MASCLKYITDLREHNQRIHKLQEDIDRFSRNEHYCEILNQEYIEATEELESLSNKWTREYVPAVERGQTSRNELYVALNQPEIFQRLVAKELVESNSSQIRSKIKAMQDSLIITKYRIASEQQSQQESKNASIDSEESLEPTVHKIRRTHSSWALSTAIEQEKALEDQHKELSNKMRSLGSRSCALSAQLKVTKEKINDLKDAMIFPAESLYSDLEEELFPIKIQAYEAFLIRLGGLGDFRFRLDAVHNQRERAARNSYIQRQQHLRSCSDMTTQSTSSIATSLASTMTDFSTIGSDFLKSTEETLDEVSARWRLPVE